MKKICWHSYLISALPFTSSNRWLIKAFLIVLPYREEPGKWCSQDPAVIVEYLNSLYVTTFTFGFFRVFTFITFLQLFGCIMQLYALYTDCVFRCALSHCLEIYIFSPIFIILNFLYFGPNAYQRIWSNPYDRLCLS